MIGMIDSGFGGLAVAKEIRRLLPNQDILYLADTAHMPYGARPSATIREYAFRGAEFLIKAGAGLLVLSCQTLASVAGESLKEALGRTVLSAAEATLTAAIEASSQKIFGLVASPATVESGFFEKTIQTRWNGARVYAVAAPLLISLVEAGWIDKPETHMMVKKHIRPLITRQIDTLMLGCPHFSLLQKTFERKAGARVHLVDGIAPLAALVKQAVNASCELERPLNHEGRLRVLVTETTARYETTARLFFKGNIRLELDRTVLKPA